jgi:hypothetical protein
MVVAAAVAAGQRLQRLAPEVLEVAEQENLTVEPQLRVRQTLAAAEAAAEEILRLPEMAVLEGPA